ncbi:MAG TPA: hypothetical protein VMH86_07740 [Rhizomicrobium sp.]|nr:hypothetical protein [Rhizomicrobium sp.]
MSDMRSYVTPAERIDTHEGTGRIVGAAIVVLAVLAIGTYGYDAGWFKAPAAPNGPPPPAVTVPDTAPPAQSMQPQAAPATAPATQNTPATSAPPRNSGNGSDTAGLTGSGTSATGTPH